MQRSMQRNVQCSVQRNMRCSMQCSMQCRTQCSMHDAASSQHGRSLTFFSTVRSVCVTVSDKVLATLRKSSPTSPAAILLFTMSLHHPHTSHVRNMPIRSCLISVGATVCPDCTKQQATHILISCVMTSNLKFWLKLVGKPGLQQCKR